MRAIFKRELFGYFNTKTALIFAVCFVFLANFLTFYLGGLLELGTATLMPFFAFHPWLYCFLLPAVSMPLFAEESRRGSIEILFSLPISTAKISIGKFMAAWAFTGICLVATMTMWITLNVIAAPDNLMIASGYVASFLAAGCILAIGINLSAITQSQTIAFILTITLSVLFLIIGSIGNLSFVQAFLPDFMLRLIYAFDLIPPYNNLIKGVIKGGDIVFFLSFIALGLVINTILLERKKS